MQRYIIICQNIPHQWQTICRITFTWIMSFQVATLKSYYKKSRAMMSQANFNLRSWASNSIQLQNLAKQDGTAETSNIVKVLGLMWNTSLDQLSLTPRDITTTTPLITKRDVLRDSSSIFDPLGLITPVTIQAKIFLQDLWGKHLQWDEPLDDELKNKWNILSQNIHSATSQTSVSRRYFQYTTSSPVALHIFADASTKAYSAGPEEGIWDWSGKIICMMEQTCSQKFAGGSLKKMWTSY